MTFVRSQHPVVDHGDVFTLPSLIGAILDLVKGVSDSVDSQILDPAFGSGSVPRRWRHEGHQ